MLPAHYDRLLLHRFGPDFRACVRIESTALERPGPGQLLIRNRWAGVNAVYDNRLAQNAIHWVETALPQDLGIESVGEVVEVGHGVSGYAPGDAVATVRLGNGYREYQCIEATAATRVPEATPEVLTLIPTGISAMVALERVAELGTGETVIVSAAAGGLGHIVIQLAKLAGNHVVALCGSEDKRVALERLGVDRTINYREDDLAAVLATQYPDGFDLAFDTVGGRIFDLFVEHLALRGRLVVSGFTSDIDDPEPVTRPRIYTELYWKAASIRGFMNHLYAEYHADAAERLLALHASGKLRVLVDPTPFDGLRAVPDAVEHLLAGRNLGKVVVRIG
jgi:hypothetical protein